MKISLKEVQKKKLLGKYSPMLLLAEKLKLKYLLKEGDAFTGPAVGLSILVDKITHQFPIHSVLDLFCGTGAVSKIALKNGVSHVDCVDIEVDLAKENLHQFEKRVRFIQTDVLKFKSKKFYDLVVADPPRELIPKLLKTIPHFKTHLFVVWHGSTEETEWNVWVRNELRKKFSKLLEVNEYCEEISCCSSTDKGKEWIEKLFASWH